MVQRNKMAALNGLALMLLILTDAFTHSNGRLVCVDIEPAPAPEMHYRKSQCGCDCHRHDDHEPVTPRPTRPPIRDPRPPTRPPTREPVTSPPYKPDCSRAADIVFILDESNSIPRDSFHQQLKFVNKVISHFDVGQNRIHIGVMSFGLDVNTNIVNLGDLFYSKGALQRRILNYAEERSHDNDRTRTDLALESCRKVMFRGARPGVAHIAIMITDGEPNLPQVGMDEARRITKVKADELKATGATLFAVGVGEFANQAQLQEIASGYGSDYVFMVDSYFALEEIEDELARRICPLNMMLQDGPAVTMVSGEMEDSTSLPEETKPTEA